MSNPATTHHEAVVRLCRALGLEPKEVRRLMVVLDPQDVITVSAELILQEDKLVDFVDTLLTYELTLKDVDVT